MIDWDSLWRSSFYILDETSKGKDFSDKIKDFINKSLAMDPMVLLIHLGCAIIIIGCITLWVWKPTNDFINAQKQKLDKERNDLVMNNRETKYFLNLLKREKSEIFDTKRRITNEAIAEANRIKSDAREYMDQQTAEMTKKAAERIGRMEEDAKDQIKNAVVNMAIELTEKLVGQNLDEKANQTIIDAYIKELETKKISKTKLN